MARKSAPAVQNGEPYTPAMIAGLLRSMPDDRLSTLDPKSFQTWPARQIVPAGTIREIITNEIARRR